jgi:quinol monooxygenase YgiN
MSMHVVMVQVTVRPERLDEFKAAILHNARQSLARDPGCLRVDVVQRDDDPAHWIFYEVYRDREAHAAHRQSAHFIAYARVAEEAVVSKSVVTGRLLAHD